MAFQRISIAQARELLQEQEMTIADVRDAISFRAGHIEGAQRLDNSSIDQFVDGNPKEHPVLVYCHHGMSSQHAASFLVEQGFTTVYSMDGGYEGWKTTP